jgi:hypothetical protein
VLKACIQACTALAELKQSAELMQQLSRDSSQFQPYA